MRKKLVTILSLTAIIFSLLVYETKADLVEDLVKKYKLDPKNNAKDQCDLMFMLLDEDTAYGCKKSGICSLFIMLYDYDKQRAKWSHKENYHLIYKDNPYKILGIAIGDSVQGYDYISYIRQKPGFPNKTEIWADIRTHEEFRKAESFKKILHLNFSDRTPRLTGFGQQPKGAVSFFKTHGCYIDDFKITDSDKKLYQPIHHN